MRELSRALQMKLLRLFDIASVTLCFGISFLSAFREGISFSSFLSLQIDIKDFLFFIILLLLWSFIFSSFHLYQSKRIGHKYQDFFDIVKCTSLCCLSILGLGLIFGKNFFDKSFFAILWLTSNFVLIFGRIFLRYVLAVLRKRGINQRFIVIVGTGSRAQDFAVMIKNKRELGYKIIGFVDDEWPGVKKLTNPLPYIGNLEEIPKVLNDNVVDEIIISLPIKSYYEKIQEIINYCEMQGIIVRFLSDIFTVSLAKSRLSFLGEIPVLSLYSAPYEDVRMIVKRFIDIFISLALLILCSPLFIVVTILIKFTTPGSVFFLQERVGYNKRLFNIIKFRTMVEDAESLLPSLEHLNEAEGPTFKIKDDPRVTKLGKFLRKTSFDELPQLLNVLKGDLSLVGPRPLPVRDYQGFNEDWQKRRFSMKPGITCFWQIEGRSNISFSKWMELDMEYIDKWSLRLDLIILWKTIPVVILGKGAY
jgi:exopolysaccharide biosynthesis polyprenyl glycosylphosphotransferase